MSVETRSKWTDLIPDTGLKITEVFDQGDEQYTPGVFAVLNKQGGDGAQVNFTGKTSFGEAQEFDEGDDVPTVARYKTYTTKVVYKNYGGAVEVTKNQIEDRDFSAELDEMKDLSRSINYSVDKSGLQLFNGGFATATLVNGYRMTWYADGVPQFSTVHPTVVPGGNTQSNASSTSIPFSDSNLEVARLALELQEQDNGLAMALAGKYTIASGINLEKKITQVTMSEKVSENANNAINMYKGPMDSIHSVFLDGTQGGSNTQWFLMNTQRHKLFQMVRQEKRLEQDVNIRNKTVTYTVDARWANASLEWKGTWGSKGDNSVYSA